MEDKNAKYKNALISVSNKSGLVEFIKPLADLGMRVVSTGGTAQVLRSAGIKVVDVSEQTGFPEVMDGRVKTLHPHVHVPLLARLDHLGDEELLKQLKLEPFDLVVVNLYPFEEAFKGEQAFDELVEEIDIGGPTLIRAAAKNFSRAAVVVNPEDYELVLKSEPSAQLRKQLAAKAFSHVSSYDAVISHALMDPQDELNSHFALGGKLEKKLRYGENPHQQAYWYQRRGARSGWSDAKILQGKELSFNNLLDLDSALRLLKQFTLPSAVAVKHNNPCGAASHKTLHEALKKCLLSDPVSVFGGIVALNRKVEKEQAQLLSELFLECVVAPAYSPEALSLLSRKKNFRVLEWPTLNVDDPFWSVQTIAGGFLVQQPDHVANFSKEWTVLGDQPDEKIRQDLEMAWKVCAALKSNAIAIVGENQTLGLGMGQVNRVDAVDLAIQRLKKFHPLMKTVVLASDAFFPFADSIDKIHEAGIRWVIQPGGSMRDEEVIARAKETGVNMVLTGQRHFRH